MLFLGESFDLGIEVLQNEPGVYALIHPYLPNIFHLVSSEAVAEDHRRAPPRIIGSFSLN